MGLSEWGTEADRSSGYTGLMLPLKKTCGMDECDELQQESTKQFSSRSTNQASYFDTNENGKKEKQGVTTAESTAGDSTACQ